MKAELHINMTIYESAGTDVACDLIRAKVCSSMHYYPGEGWSVSFYPDTRFMMSEESFRVRAEAGLWVRIPVIDINDIEIRQTGAARA